MRQTVASAGSSITHGGPPSAVGPDVSVYMFR